MPLISNFDPWRSSLCTCPAKLTLNPYSGCDHQCIYCYASSYIPNFQNCRVKKDLLTNLKKESAKLKGEMISIANSSDPYPRIEATTGITRKCLEILTDSNCKIQIITKSNIVTRDDDLLTKAPSTVALTITTDDETIAEQIEPHAPSPNQRLRAVEDLLEKGIPVSVRIDPIIPNLNDNPEKLISILANMGVRHVTSSTYKPKPDNWNRLSKIFPDITERLKPFYFQEGEKIGGNTLLPKDMRFRLMKNIHDLVVTKGMQFGVCRENLAALNTASCDGSWMFKLISR